MRRNIIRHIKQQIAGITACSILSSGQPIVVSEAGETCNQKESENMYSESRAEASETIETESEAAGKEYICSSGLTSELLQEYQKDGTYEERSAFVQALEAEKEMLLEQKLWKDETGSKYLSDGSAAVSSADTGIATATQAQDMPYGGLMPSVGDVKALVFLVEFPDYAQTNSGVNVETVKDELFGKSPYSLTEWYATSSYEKLNITGEVYGYYTAQYEAEHYENGSVGRQELIVELMEYYDEQIDFSQYDADGDGIIDALYIDYVMQTDGWGSFWWNYQAAWNGLTEEGEPASYDGVEINRYIWMNRNGNSEASEVQKTYLHETGHLLGLPDYYNSVSGTTYGGIETVDMMSVNAGDHNALSKLLLGWIENPKTITDTAEVSLTPSAQTPDMAILYPDGIEENGEYFVLEYVTAYGNNSEIGAAIGSGGIRVFRVNTTWKDDGTGFKYANDGGSIRFIESVGITELNSLGLGKIRGNGLLNLYFEYDEWGPYTTPSSYVHQIEDSGKSKFSATGITMDNIQFQDGIAYASIVFDSVEKEGFTYTIDYQFENIALITLNFESETVLLDSSAVRLYSENKELEIQPEIFDYSGDEYKKLVINAVDTELSETEEYTLQIGAGALVDAFGNTNAEICETISSDNKWKKEAIISSSGSYAYESEYISYNNQSVCNFSVSDGCVIMNMITAKGDEVEQETYEYHDILYTQNASLECIQMEENHVVLAIKNANADSVQLYSFESPDEYRYVGRYSATGMTESMRKYGDKVLYLTSWNEWSIIDLGTGDREIITTVDIGGTDTRMPIEIENIGYLVYENRKLYLLDENGTVLVEQENTNYRNFSENEEFRGACEYNGEIIMLITDGAGSVYLAVFDHSLNRSRTILLCQDSLYEYHDIQKVDGGYLIEGRISSSMSTSHWLGNENLYMCVVSQTLVLDAHLQYVTSITKYGQEKKTLLLNERFFFGYYSQSYGGGVWCYTGCVELEGKQNSQSIVMIKQEQLNLAQNKECYLTISGEQSFVNEEICWSSSDSDIVEVLSDGTLIPKKKGKAVITMTCGASLDTCQVTVCPIVTSYGKIEFYFSDAMTAYLENGTLTIERESWYIGGPMPNFDWGDGTSCAPWYDYRNEIDTVVVDENITSIGNCAFMDCKYLECVIMPDTITSIEMYAFKNSGISKLDIPAGVTYIGIEMSECPNLESLNINSENTSYVFENGMLMNYDRTKLYGCSVQTEGTVVLPDTVTKCQKTAFFECEKIEEIHISEKLEKIPKLQGCAALEKIVIPEDFAGTFEENCFQDCLNLRELIVPEYTKSIPLGTIYYSGLNKVLIQGMNTQIDDSGLEFQKDKFEGITDCTLYAYEGSVADSFMNNEYVSAGYKTIEEEFGICFEYVCFGRNVSELQKIELKMESEYVIEEDVTGHYLQKVSGNTLAGDLLEHIRNTKEQICIYHRNGSEIADMNVAISTGDYVQLERDGMILDIAYIVVLGDVNGTGTIDVLDMEAIQKSILNIQKLRPEEEKAALVTGEATVSVLDMEAIQKYILGIADIF